MCFNQGKFEQAVDCFTKLINLYPLNPCAHLNRAKVYRVLSKNESALSDIARAIELNPNNTYYFRLYGSICLDIGKYIEAANYFRKVKVLNQETQQQQLLDESCFYWELKDIITELGEGMEIDARDDEGRNTALHLAVDNKNQELMEYLLKNGASINSQNARGFSPLHLAAFIGDVDLAKLLISNGADVNIVDNGGNTPLHKAIFYTDITKLLLDNGAEPNILNTMMLYTPLEKAVVEGIPEVVEIMIRAGANPALAKDKHGSTKLHYSAANGDLRAMECLLSQGAVINYKNKVGQTPLHAAVWSGNIKAAEFLMINGANSNIPDINGDSPLQLALDAGHEELVNILTTYCLTG